jgi:hypothetical protein
VFGASNTARALQTPHRYSPWKEIVPPSELTAQKRVAFWIIMLAGTLGLGELISRTFLLPPALYPRREEYALIVKHPDRGFTLAPNAKVQYHRGGNAYALGINGRGFRGGSFDVARSARIRLLTLGDSFTFGLGVDSSDTWPAQVEAMLRTEFGSQVHVVNAGVPAYSARQMRQVTEELMPELRPSIVLFGLNSETYWRVNGPYLLRGGELVSSDISPHVSVGRRGLYYSRYTDRPLLSRIDLWLNRNFELGAQLLEATHRVYGFFLPRRAQAPPAEPDEPVDHAQIRQAMVPALEEIAKARDVARSGGAEFVVVLINPQRPDGSFADAQYAYNSAVVDFCRARGIAVVDPLPELVRAAHGKPIFRSTDDYHWTGAADHLAAGQVYIYLTQSSLAMREFRKNTASILSRRGELAALLPERTSVLQ